MSHLSIARLTLILLLLAGVLAPMAEAQYKVPPDNPFVSNPLARGEIYVYGMSNPYRWSFDRLTGDMWIGDVRDPDLGAFSGKYLFGRLNTGIYQLESNGTATQKSNIAAVSGFGEDGVGHLYATSLGGQVYR